MDPWTRMRWRRRWRRLRPLIVATVLAAIVVLILVLLAQYLNGSLWRPDFRCQADPQRAQARSRG